MKITGISAICLKYPCKTIIADGCTPCLNRMSVLIRIDTDTELYGIGEAATFGGNMQAMKILVEKQLAHLLIGEDPLNIEFLWNKMAWNNWASGRHGMVMGAISGIDIALWDLLGKAANMPLYQLLGANSSKVPTYASAGFYAENKTIDDLKREMEKYRAMGFTAYKMKIGRTKDLVSSPLRYMNGGDHTISFDEDVRRIAAVREAIGPSARLMVDMNCTWDTDSVIANKDLFDAYNIYWVEEPSRNDDAHGYVRIAQALGKTLVAGIESEQGLGRFTELIEMGALDVVQLNIGWSGGITESRKIAAVALAHNKLFAPHTFFSGVLNAANAHFAASLTNVPFIEYELNENPLRTELLKEPLILDSDMQIHLTDKPGLGIDVDWEQVDKYFCKD